MDCSPLNSRADSVSADQSAESALVSSSADVKPDFVALRTILGPARAVGGVLPLKLPNLETIPGPRLPVYISTPRNR
ncbi:MAG: hypothetical protein D6695_01970 [Planctomycetota bacterium]|nr:MAG: hypothetical protein D6695_01970 [Planctomycetota bacterium]